MSHVCVLTLPTLRNFNGLFHSLFGIELKQSVGVKGLISAVFVDWALFTMFVSGYTPALYVNEYLHDEFNNTNADCKTKFPTCIKFLNINLRINHKHVFLNS